MKLSQALFSTVAHYLNPITPHTDQILWKVNFSDALFLRCLSFALPTVTHPLDKSYCHIHSLELRLQF